MKLLLDTHVFIGWMFADPRLPPRTRGTVFDPAHDLFLSSISGVEWAIKVDAHDDRSILTAYPLPRGDAAGHRVEEIVEECAGALGTRTRVAR